VFQSLADVNITKVEQDKFPSYLRQAHQLLATAILVRLGFDVWLCTAKVGPYYAHIAVFQDGPGSAQHLIRAQVRTVSPGGTLSFVAGRRGGINGEYISGGKEYVYTTEHNDLIVGVDPNKLDLYLVPTIFVESLGQKSITIRKLQSLKNNWDILLHWNDDFLSELGEQL